MAGFQNAVTVQTTRQNAYLHTSKRNAIHRKGKSSRRRTILHNAYTYSAKYIEGLENRLGRMEQLLKISGLITDEEAGRSDLGAIERRLAEKKSQAVKPSSPRQIHDTATPSSQQQDSRIGTPQHTVATPQDSVTSPSSNSPKTADVESISDMMCSLVTNGSGETRYIGLLSLLSARWFLMLNRFVFGVFDFLSERHRVGEREDWR